MPSHFTGGLGGERIVDRWKAATWSYRINSVYEVYQQMYQHDDHQHKDCLDVLLLNKRSLYCETHFFRDIRSIRTSVFFFFINKCCSGTYDLFLLLFGTFQWGRCAPCPQKRVCVFVIRFILFITQQAFFLGGGYFHTYSTQTVYNIVLLFFFLPSDNVWHDRQRWSLKITPIKNTHTKITNILCRLYFRKRQEGQKKKTRHTYVTAQQSRDKHTYRRRQILLC